MVGLVANETPLTKRNPQDCVRLIQHNKESQLLESVVLKYIYREKSSASFQNGGRGFSDF
jgi:hypothetical protein